MADAQSNGITSDHVQTTDALISLKGNFGKNGILFIECLMFVVSSDIVYAIKSNAGVLFIAEFVHINVYIPESATFDLNVRPAIKDASMDDSYVLEFNITSAVAKLPRCFGKEHGTEINEYIMLCDPNNNEIEVQVAIKDNKVYFKNGWFGMKDFYAIDIGAWALLTYEDSSFMRMSLKNRFHQELAYPLNDPPIIAKLDRDLTQCSSLDFCLSSVVILTDSDVKSGFLVMPWIGFSKSALPSKESEMKVVDYLGFAWKCSFRIVEVEGELVCKIGGAWGALCKARRLQPKQPLKLVVTHEVDNRIVYLKHVPFPSMQKGVAMLIDKIVCLDAAEAGFPLTGTIVRVADEVSLQEMRMLNTYYVELETTTPKTRLPACFAKEYGLHVDDYVMLRDPNRNMFEVRVHRKKGKVYLRDGWAELKDFYKLERRAWVTLTYVEPNLMDITIADRSGVEINYPNKFLPPMSKMIVPHDGGPIMRFYRSFVHILSATDVSSGYLVVPWFGFGVDALPKTEDRLSIIDHYGNVWRCPMDFIRMDDSIFCRIGGDWKLLCTARRLTKGYAIKLGVTDNSRSGVLHIRYAPLNCVHRGFVRSRDTVDARHMYQVNHYFADCPLRNKCGSV